jgi:hypothetical protein
MEALRKYGPAASFNAENHTTAIPRWIAGPALNAERRNAIAGLILAGVNSIFAAWLLAKTKPASRPAASPPQFDSLGGRHL